MKSVNGICRVTVGISVALMATMVSAAIESAVLESADVRFDGRATFGGRVVSGVEILGEADGSQASSWDSTTRADGWHTLTSGDDTREIYVQNSSTVRVEGGRLAGDAVWSNDVTHLVRNWVVVPSGTTLKVAMGAVVKFCPGVGIHVEDGGTLNVVGEKGKDAIFTSVYDDTAGTIVDCGKLPESAIGGFVLQSGAASFSDNCWIQTRMSCRNDICVKQWERM